MKLMFVPINKIYIKLFYFFSIATILTLIILFSFDNYSVPVTISKDQLTVELKEMFASRDNAALKGDVASVKEMFNTSAKLGLWAYEHEKKRTEYLKNWTIIRKTKFISMESDVRVQRVREKGGSIWIDFLHSGKFTYVYLDLPEQPVSFGIGTRRTIELVKKDDKWIIKREWYLDPFEDVLEVPEELKDDVQQNSIVDNSFVPVFNENYTEEETETTVGQKKKRYDREKAVAYADKYSGVTFGSGNNYKYNRKYRDFTGLGGDCSNFTSQVLSDKEEGGGLRMDGSWYYSFTYKGVGGGTISWVRALNLKNYLLYSGKAKLIKRGTLEQVMEPTSTQPEGAYKLLEKGDLVAYEDKKSIDHFSVVTEFDPKGLPLVNSHTTDRYRVPWDLGWSGKQIKYWLLHIRD